MKWLGQEEEEEGGGGGNICRNSVREDALNHAICIISKWILTEFKKSLHSV